MLIVSTAGPIAPRNVEGKQNFVAGNAWTLPPSSVCRWQAQGPQSSRQAELHKRYYTYMYRVRYLELQEHRLLSCRHPAPRT